MSKPNKNTLTYVDSYGNSHIIHNFWEDTINDAMKDIINILRYGWFWESTIAKWLEDANLDF